MELNKKKKTEIKIISVFYYSHYKSKSVSAFYYIKIVKNKPVIYIFCLYNQIIIDDWWIYAM